MNATERQITKNISVVIPLLNEAEGLQELYDRLRRVLISSGSSFELIFIDDGSDDGSFEILKKLHESDDRVTVIQFRKNYGKAAALCAGFQQASGNIVITMDADLQDLPEEIPPLIHKLEEGYELVSGWKVERRDPFSRRLASRIFNTVVSALTGIRLHDFNSGFKCYRSEVTRELRLHGELHRYIPVLAAWKGFRVGEVRVEHHPRRYGRSKYGLSRALRGVFDLITVMTLTRYSHRPLHLFGLLGFVLGFIGLIINLYLSIRWFFGEWLTNRPLLLLGMLLLIVGVQFVFFGLLAEMTAYSAPQDEPYHIRQKLE